MSLFFRNCLLFFLLRSIYYASGSIESNPCLTIVWPTYNCYFFQKLLPSLELSTGASAVVFVKMGCCFMFGKKAKQAVEGDEGWLLLLILAWLLCVCKQFPILTNGCFLIPDLHSVKVFSYNELRKATQGFSDANKIGEGGFGSVFRVNITFSSTSSASCADRMKNPLGFHFNLGY
jgi:hypothetical protein